MNAFTTHPSVRIKGTENNYEPTQCVNPNCPNRNPHMHCPFCVNTDNYHDPVILKAHYRVKHVDKGIDFAGLKILRCCDHCDIVGTIKGTKEFKGAHWHCYRCRNGFNRRDEAIKHYRTHFRNPQTTFQIQIAQEVNQENYESDNAANTITHITQEDGSEGIISTSPLSATAFTTIHQTEGSQINGKDGEIQVSVAANETVGAEGQTIMIIQADEHLDASQVQNALNNANIQEVANLEYTGVLEAEKSKWEQKLTDLQQKYNKSEAEHKEREQKLKTEIAFLKGKVQNQATEIAELQKREQELMTQLSIPLDNHIHDLLVQLKSQHEDLLHQQLAQVRRAYIQQFGHQAISITTDRTSENSVPSNIVFVQSPGGSNIRLVEEETSDLSDGTEGAGRIVIMKAEEMENKSGESEEERHADDAADSYNSELVISTESGDIDKGDVNKVDESSEAEVLVSETTVCEVESIDNETVVQVTLTGSTPQQAENVEEKTAERISVKPEEKEPESSPRSKRRKKSH